MKEHFSKNSHLFQLGHLGRYTTTSLVCLRYLWGFLFSFELRPQILPSLSSQDLTWTQLHKLTIVSQIQHKKYLLQVLILKFLVIVLFPKEIKKYLFALERKKKTLKNFPNCLSHKPLKKITFTRDTFLYIINCIYPSLHIKTQAIIAFQLPLSCHLLLLPSQFPLFLHHYSFLAVKKVWYQQRVPWIIEKNEDTLYIVSYSHLSGFIIFFLNKFKTILIKNAQHANICRKKASKVSLQIFFQQREKWLLFPRKSKILGSPKSSLTGASLPL